MNLHFMLSVLKQVNVVAVKDKKDLNVKVFNLMLRTNETRHIKWYEACKCVNVD